MLKSFVIKHLEIYHSHFFSSIFVLVHLPNNLFHKTRVSHSMPVCGQRGTQLCLTLCSPMDYSLPGSSTHGISQGRILEWVAISSPRSLPDPGMKPVSLAHPALQAGPLSLHHPGGLYISVFSNASLLHTHLFHRYQTLVIDSRV